MTWTNRNVETEQERRHHAELQAEAVVLADRLLRVVDRERGRHQDRGVEARDQLRQVVALGRPFGAAHDPHEEVGREERAEDHHLGDDEKQHPEERGLDPRGAVGLGRAVMVIVDVRGCGGHLRLRLRVRARCARRDVGGVSHAIDELVRHPLRRALGQRRDDDLGDVEVLHRVHHRGVRIGVADHPRGDDPGVVQRREQRLEPLARLGHPVALDAALRHDRDEAARALVGQRLQPLDQFGRGHGEVRDDQRHVERQALAGQVDDHVLDRLAGRLLEPLDQVAPQPAGGRRRQGRDDDLVDLVRRTASIAALNGSWSPTSPAPAGPRSRMNSTARSTRTCAESRTTSS